MTEPNQQSSLLGKIAAYTEILAKDPKSTIFVSLGEAYRKMGMLDDARQVIEKGLERHTDFSPAHIVIARILCQQGEYARSEIAFQNALQHDPESLAALVGYARLNLLLGQESKARELLLDARKLSPADPVINKLLLSLPDTSAEETTEKVATVSIETSEAADEEPGSTEDSSEPVVLPLASSTLAELYLKQGLAQQALDVYRQLSSEEPENLQFRRKIRELEESLTVSKEHPLAEVPVAKAQDRGVEQPVISDVQSSPVAEVENPFISDQAEAVEEIEDVSFTEAALSSGDEKALATLNRWLDSIQQRREDV